MGETSQCKPERCGTTKYMWEKAGVHAKSIFYQGGTTPLASTSSLHLASNLSVSQGG